MPTTYSININTSTEAYRLETIEDVLNQIPDNDDKLVIPHYIRDAIYSTWENAIFKQNIGSGSIEYVGIERDDIFNKVYFGKKSLLNNNIMSSSLLSFTSSDTDIFFFNNKSNSNLSQQDLKISIISGTNSLLYNYSPYIKSRVAVGLSSSQVIQLDIGNDSGNINIYSANKIYINGRFGTTGSIGFPSILETSASASNDKILVYDSSNGSLFWTLNSYATSSVGTSSATSSILGLSVLLNGHDIELSDSRPVITSIGSIKTGKIFDNSSIVDVVNEMLYSYIPPSCSLSISPSFAEKGNPGTSIQIGWTINKKTDDIVSALFSSGNVIGYTSPAPITTPGSSIISSPPYVLGIPPAGFTSTYTFTVQDSGISNNNTPTTASSSIDINLVYPYFSGVSSTNAVNPSQVNSILSSLTKSVTGKMNKEVPLLGTGYIYFAYPVSSGGATYGLLSSILDENGSVVTSYTYSIYSGPGLTSPSSYWSNIPYVVYKIGPITVGFPNPVTWTFNY